MSVGWHLIPRWPVPFGRLASRTSSPLALAVTLALGCLATAARATELADRHGYVRLDGGIASAVGFGGLSVGYSPGQYFAVEVGAGYGFTGAQLSLMPKLLIGTESDRFALGVGPSVSFELGNSSEIVPWLNLDVGYEHRFSVGISISLAVGYTGSLSKFTYSISGDGDDTPTTHSSAQARLGVGYWF